MVPGVRRAMRCAAIATAFAAGIDSVHAQESHDSFVEILCHPPRTALADVRLGCVVPLPRDAGLVAMPEIVVGGRRVTWCVPHRRWPDATLRAVRVGFAADLVAGESIQRLGMSWRRGNAEDEAPPVDRAADRTAAAVMPRAWRSELEDPWGRTWIADVTLEPVEEIGSCAFPVVWRGRAAHRLVGAESAQSFLDLELTLARPSAFARRGELTVRLVNDGEGPAGPLGPVRLRGLALWFPSGVQAVPRNPALQLIPPPSARSTDGVRQGLLGPDDALYLGDRTAKTWRFDVWLGETAGGENGPQDEAGHERVRALVRCAPYARVDLATWRRTGAFGTFGGPAPAGGGVEEASIARALATWRGTRSFGPFGGFGDVLDAGAGGSPRNGPFALASLLRWDTVEAWWIAESMVLQQSLRPPAFPPTAREPAATAFLRTGLGERARRTPHGFTASEYEHTSVDIVADWHLLTADPAALRELRRFAASIPGTLAAVEFRTCRGEGWTLLAGTRAAAALPDTEGDRLRAQLLDHVRTRLLPALADADATAAVLPQPAHARVLGGREPFDAPWQMAALVLGLTALHRATDDAICRATALEVARRMTAPPAWLPAEDELPERPKEFFAVRDATLFERVEERAHSGTDRHLIPALVLAGELAEPGSNDAGMFATRLRALVGERGAPGVGRAEAVSAAVSGRPVRLPDRWIQLWLDRSDGGIPVGESAQDTGADGR